MTLRIAVAIACVISASSAMAQPADPVEPSVPAVEKPASDRAKDQFAEGQKHFLAGEYLPAAESFSAAYALDPDPVYLYNIAQSYRLGSACAKAADFYRKFLVVVPKPPNLDKVTHYLEELDACAKAESSLNGVAAPPTALTDPIQPPDTRRDTKPPLVERDNGRGERVFGFATGLAGIAALATGALLTHDVHTLEGYSAAICAPGAMCEWDATKQARAEDLKRRGDRDSSLQVGAYAFGGAAIVGGIVLYMLGDHARHERIVGIVPLRGGGAVVTQLHF